MWLAIELLNFRFCFLTRYIFLKGVLQNMFSNIHGHFSPFLANVLPFRSDSNLVRHTFTNQRIGIKSKAPIITRLTELLSFLPFFQFMFREELPLKLHFVSSLNFFPPKALVVSFIWCYNSCSCFRQIFFFFFFVEFYVWFSDFSLWTKYQYCRMHHNIHFCVCIFADNITYMLSNWSLYEMQFWRIPQIQNDK